MKLPNINKLTIGIFMALNAMTLVCTAQEPVATDKEPIAKRDVSETKSNDRKQVTKEESKETETKPAKKKEFSEAIADNSFYIEEAYNQEPGIMQTINTCAWFRRPSGDVLCTVTQEFPVNNQKHQISYTLPFSSIDSGQAKGLGDLGINYRYQLTGEKAWATVAPRFSLLLPTGSERKGLGTGSTGMQFNLPVSKRLSEKFAAHFNAGMTFLPKVKGADSQGNTFKRNLTSYNTGGSLVWLTNKRFNMLFEYVENFSSEIDEQGRVNRFNEHIINPGVRFAVDIGSLQIVPGIAAPTSISRGNSRTGVFFYVSFEHPFKKSNQ